MNKTQRREQSAREAMGIAMQALERIEAHEKECGERWSQTIVEIKHLQELTSGHSARWEKLAWLVVAAVTVHIISGML